MPFIKGTIFLFLVTLNTVFWVPVLLLFSLVKFIVPVKVVQSMLSKFLVWIANNWIWLNSSSHHLLHGNKTEVVGLGELDMDDWYLVISNHCSAADIPILQTVFKHKIPLLKFFLKKELIYVPLLGMAWWALDFPFMRRFSAG